MSRSGPPAPRPHRTSRARRRRRGPASRASARAGGPLAGRPPRARSGGRISPAGGAAARGRSTGPRQASRATLHLRQLAVVWRPWLLYPRGMRLRRVLLGSAKALGILAVLFGLIQLIPYGRTHSNPSVNVEPPWDSPRTRELAVRACFDCHSNHTKWPWYADVAPFSWVVQKDVDNA